MAKTELKCPNCGSPALAKEGGKYVCTNIECGATFTFQEGEARLTAVGEYEALRKDVDHIKSRQGEIDKLLGEPDRDPEDDRATSEREKRAEVEHLTQGHEDPEGDDEDDEDDDEEDW